MQLRAQRQELLEACEMEQIQLRTTGGDAVALELDTAGAPTAASLDQDLDYSSLPRRFVQVTCQAHCALVLLGWYTTTFSLCAVNPARMQEQHWEGLR